MTPAVREEHRLAVMTSWGFLGSFGVCLVLSGFAGSDPVLGLAGFATIVAAFVAHVIINRIFGTAFTAAQVALGLVVLVVAILSFVIGWLVDPAFGQTDILVGLAGFGAIVAALVLYALINYGVQGSYAMVHDLRAREHGGP